MGDILSELCSLDGGLGKVGACAWLPVGRHHIYGFAAGGGHLKVLQWVREHGCPWDANTCHYAAEGGHPEVLRWAHEHGCPWDASTCTAAAGGGHLKVLQWAREHSCPWDASTCSGAALGGNLEVLQWARDHGCPWNAYRCSGAATGGHMMVLQWAREHGCPWHSRTCAVAAEGGHLEVLQWAREHGCPWDASTCSGAAGGGYLKMLQWAREHGCPWDPYRCAPVALGGHLEVMQWAREHGCPWHTRTCRGLRRKVSIWKCCSGRASMAPHGTPAHVLVAGGHLEMLQWAREHGCLWVPRTRAVARKVGIWKCCSGLLSMAARGTPTHVLVRQEVGICWRGLGKVGARSWLPVALPHMCGCGGRWGIWKCCSGRTAWLPVDANTCSWVRQEGICWRLQWARGAGCPWHSPAHVWLRRKVGI
ncbi:hypothetical protein CYMTET_24824 [Cymbomonas tetramitiformis]|uniref:Ankyrin repeat protein n=1 Tax=Cymbomonas tetramitiformis TaxID=36881 RepID=A0AAE0FV17_9CHLO|nr:hypothetical protein CYMTET_24824 [Cymbomonas tetramitiformis]